MSNLSDSNTTHLVIDLGSSSIKCGFNEENAPRIVIPNVLGVQKKNLINLIDQEGKMYFGKDAIINSPCLDLIYPQIRSNGKIAMTEQDSEYLEKTLRYIFEKELKIKQDGNNVFIIDSLYTSKKEKYEIAKILFEKFNFYNIHIQPQSVMTLYSSAKSTGVVITSGENFTEIVPVYEGFIIPKGIRSSPIAGKEMTNKFIEALTLQLDYYNIEAKYEMAKMIKEENIEVLEDFDNDINIKENNQKEFELPDGNKISIGNERYEIAEMMFHPENFGKDLEGVHEGIWNSVMKTDLYVRKELMHNIILAGGNSLIKGFPERITKEVNMLIDKNFEGSGENKMSMKILASPERQYSAWFGASGISSFSNFQAHWISKTNYDENGESIFKNSFIFEVC